MNQQINTSISQNDGQNSISARLEKITDNLLTPKQAWEALKIGKTRFYTLVSQGHITLVRFDYAGRKTFVKRSELALLFPKDFIN
jgi:hypothetical protein